MKEVVKCSISGVSFTLDADAYAELTAYLESLKTNYKESPDGAEIIADIEARIAELILSAQNNTCVVEKPLILNIIQQMGSVEDISDVPAGVKHPEEPRIPRRLYRDTENAKLGGVCAGIGKYFDVDPVWVRLSMFLPVLLMFLQWIPFMDWVGVMLGNLFGIFVVCYIIMWFAVPAARTARQVLEMNGERITADSIKQTTEAASVAAASDPDSKAKPIVAEAVSVFGKVVLILLKIFAGLMVFSLIMAACALIIGIFAIVVGGTASLPFGGTVSLPFGLLDNNSVWLPVLGILTVLIPIFLLIYVLMCLIASRKPSGRTVLVTFIIWLLSFMATAFVAISSGVYSERRQAERRSNSIEQMAHKRIVIGSDTLSLEELLRQYGYDLEEILDNNGQAIDITIPERDIEVMIDKAMGSVSVEVDGKRISLETVNEPSGAVRQQAAEPAQQQGAEIPK